LILCLFFFSSRRRHTRSKRDWSSDVCSSDLDGQKNSSNTIHIDIIQSMEQVMDAIDSFAGATLLQGKTYNTAKTYMSAVFRPLAQGIINLSEELIRQNSNYPDD